MQEFKGKVAVVTGAASGIGRGLVERFASEGMSVVLSDIEKEPLAIADQELQSDGADVLAVQTDVSSLESVEALRDQVLERFGKVHILCNNAGVSGGGGSGRHLERHRGRLELGAGREPDGRDPRHPSLRTLDDRSR